MMKKEKNQTTLPASFRPLLWSYDFPAIDPFKNKKMIIVQTINYGDLNHWRWLVKCYGTKKIQEVLEQIPATELRPRAKRLATVIFGLRSFNNAPRGTRPKK